MPSRCCGSLNHLLSSASGVILASAVIISYLTRPVGAQDSFLSRKMDTRELQLTNCMEYIKHVKRHRAGGAVPTPSYQFGNTIRRRETCFVDPSKER